MVSEERLARLQLAGLVARVVRHRKGHINRAILVVGPGEPTPILAGDLGGTRYSFREHIHSGYHVWVHRRLPPGTVPTDDEWSERSPAATAAGTGA